MQYEFYVATVVIGALAYLLVRRADEQRSEAVSEHRRTLDILKTTTESNRQALLSAETARQSLKELAHSRKKEIEELREQLEDMQNLAEEEESEEEGEEEEGEITPVIIRKKKQEPDKIAALAITLQNRMRKARELVESSMRGTISLSVKENLKELHDLLDTDLATLEKEQ